MLPRENSLPRSEFCVARAPALDAIATLCGERNTSSVTRRYSLSLQLSERDFPVLADGRAKEMEKKKKKGKERSVAPRRRRGSGPGEME